MKTKAEAISLLKQEFAKWDDFFTRREPSQRQSVLYGNRTIKDEMAHLWEWQRMSQARLYAAVNNIQPDFSYWPDWFDTLVDNESEDEMDKINEWIYQQNKGRSWDKIYSDWKMTFNQVLSLADQIPEEKYNQEKMFSWLGEYKLMDVLEGSYKHYHEDHWPNIIRWQQHS